MPPGNDASSSTLSNILLLLVESVAMADWTTAVLARLFFLDGLLSSFSGMNFLTVTFLIGFVRSISPLYIVGSIESSCKVVDNLVSVSLSFPCGFPSEQAAMATSPAAIPATLIAFPAVCLRRNSCSKSLTSCSHFGQVPLHSPLKWHSSGE